MSDNFYRAFEDIHRGSRELIIGRLRVYLEYIQPLLEIYPDSSNIIDLGCGRGEWLELLSNEGFEVKGVDLDKGMLQACEELQLSVDQADALEMLRQLDDESQVVVSGFHIVEHVPFDYLIDMVTEAYRVLKPGGLAIFETPNAENLVVGTNSFYLDPTHKQPIPHQLLSFLTEYVGFQRNKVLRLQENPQLAESRECTLEQVFSGVSPDYAVVAQKPADSGVTEKFDEAFARERGIGLTQLSRKYDKIWQERISALIKAVENGGEFRNEVTQKIQQLEEKNSFYQQLISVTGELADVKTSLAVSKVHEQYQLNEIKELKNVLDETLSQLESLKAEKLKSEREPIQSHSALHESKAKADHWYQKATEAQAQLEETVNKLNESLGNAHHWYERANGLESKLNEANQAAHHWWQQTTHQDDYIQALHRSTSWRITAPLRGFKKGVIWLLMLPLKLFKTLIKPFVYLGLKWVINKPGLRDRLSAKAKKYPRLHQHLRQFASNQGLVATAAVSGDEHPMARHKGPHKQNLTPEQEKAMLAMTPREQRIFMQLNRAIERKRQG